MKAWIIESSVKLRLMVIILAVMLMAVGIMQLRQMPISIFPEVDPPYVEVQTEALGLSAEEVEAFLTVPMEADLLNGVAWLNQIYSRSVPGLSSILLIFEPGTDPIQARQMVQERLTEAYALPNVSTPPVMMQPLSSANRAIMVGLSSEELSLIEMGVLARWNIKPRLLGVPGVANVSIWGQRERQLQVQVDPEELHARGVTLQQIIQTAGEALWVSPLTYLQSSTPGTAGWIDTPNQRLSIRHLLPITTAEDLAKVVVVDRKDLVLGDVARVVEDHQPLIGDANLNDGPGLLLVIEKFPGANTLEVTRGVEKALRELQPGLQGMTIDTNVFRPADFIELAVENLGILALVGFVLVALALLAFYAEWRAAFISLIVIPLSLIAAGMVLYFTGATFNVTLLLGIAAALSVVIDDAVVDVDNIRRRLREAREAGDDTPTESIVVGSLLESRRALDFALLIILLALLPLFFLPGLTGSLVQPVATSYILAIVASLLVALIVTPALSVTLMPSAPVKGPSSLALKLQSLYRGILERTIRLPYAALAVSAILVIVALLVLPLFDFSLLPQLRQHYLLVDFEAAPGTSRIEMVRITSQASEELRAIPGVQGVGSHIGRAIAGDAVVGINSGELWVGIDPKANYEETLAAIQSVVDGYPGLSRKVDTYLPRRFKEILTGTEDDVTIRVYGHELDVLHDKAQDVAQIVAGVDGVTGVQPISNPYEAQLEIEVDLEKAEAHGIKPGDVRRQATILLSGIQVGNLFEEQKVFDVVVWGIPELRTDLTDVNELKIDLPSGRQVPLGDLADVRIAPAPSVIERDAVSRYLDVVASIGGRSVDAVAADIRGEIAGLDIPFEYHVEVLSDAQQVQNNLPRLLAIVLAALAGIYLLLQAALGSWRLAFLLLVTLPVSLVGGVLAALLSDGVLTIGSLFGFFAILALSIRNSLVLVSNLQTQSEVEGEDFGPELVIRGSAERAVPIVLTAIATGLALLPVLVAGNMVGVEILRPTAMVIVGGLVTATLLNLFAIPALYLRWPAVSTAVTEPPAEARLAPTD